MKKKPPTAFYTTVRRKAHSVVASKFRPALTRIGSDGCTLTRNKNKLHFNTCESENRLLFLVHHIDP